MSTYHFVGAGGIGMSALAQVLLGQGHTVTGSDRYLDMGRSHPRLAKLRGMGVRLSPQDGSGVRDLTDCVVVSTAIEDDNPDLVRAGELGVSVAHRSDILADIFHGAADRVAVTGSCGKTTIVAMIGWLLSQAGLDPTVIDGGVMRNFERERGIGNVLAGSRDMCVIEADESDGSCVRFRPTVGVITAIARDHREKHELMVLYEQFAAGVETALILNADDPALAPLARDRQTLTYGFSPGADVRGEGLELGPGGGRFRVGGQTCVVSAIGRHNIHNALAALAVRRALGLAERPCAALASFRGVERRMEVVGEAGGARVYDDYAHNPSKIAAAIEAARSAGASRVLAVFQPHGFGPARFMEDELVATLGGSLGADDRAWLLPIYYVGGTAKKDVSSERIASEARARGAPVRPMATRDELVDEIARDARSGDAVIVMGARDDTLTDLAKRIAAKIGTQKGRAVDSD